jgi:hypothetical protein
MNHALKDLPCSKKWGQPLTYDNLSKSLHTPTLGFYPSLVSFKTSGLAIAEKLSVLHLVSSVL